MLKNLILVFFLIFSLQAVAAGVPGSAIGPVQSTETPNVIGKTTTINAQCVTPTAGCAAGQGASIKLGGRNTVTAQVITANFTGTLLPYISSDNGVTWTPGIVRSGIGLTGASTPNGVALAANTSTLQLAILVPYGGATDVMLASTAAVTNTATVQLTASSALANIAAWATIKGSQPNAGVGVALSTQDLKDAGRSFVVLSADGVTPAIAETLITFSKDVAGTVTGAQTTYAITSGKTLRVQSICASMTAGAAANRVRVALRLNTGGACIASSGLLLPALELAPQYGTAAASEGWAGACVPIPDGLELTGASWNVCLSEVAVAASGTLTVNLIGYEY